VASTRISHQSPTQAVLLPPVISTPNLKQVAPCDLVLCLTNDQQHVCRHIKVMTELRSRCAAAAMQRAENPPLDYLNGLHPREADIRRTRCLDAALTRFVTVPRDSTAGLVRSAPGVGSKRQRLDDIPFLNTAQGKNWLVQLFGDWRCTPGYAAQKRPVDDPIAAACRRPSHAELHARRRSQDAEWYRECRKRQLDRQDQQWPNLRV
jgi:hypothetical protein